MSERHNDDVPEGTAEVLTILIVENDEDIGAFLVQAILQETLYQALRASSAAQALEMITTLKPNLFVLDYHLPQMNGIDFYDHLQSMKAFVGIPALIISARLPTQELAQRQLPSLQKPFELDTFLRTIETILSAYH